MCSVKIQFHGIAEAVAKPISWIPYLIPLASHSCLAKSDCWEDRLFRGRGGIMVSSQWSCLWCGTKYSFIITAVLSWKLSNLNNGEELCRIDRGVSVWVRVFFSREGSFMTLQCPLLKARLQPEKNVYDQKGLILIKKLLWLFSFIVFPRGSSKHGSLP